MFDQPSLFVLPNSDKKNSVGISVISKSLEFADAPKDLSQVGDAFRRRLIGWNYTLISEEDVTIGGLPAKRIVFVDQLTSIDEKVRHIETCLFHKNRFLRIGFTSPEIHFDAQWQEARTFFDSLRFVS